MASGKEGGRSRAPGTSIPSAAHRLILRAASQRMTPSAPSPGFAVPERLAEPSGKHSLPGTAPGADQD